MVYFGYLKDAQILSSLFNTLRLYIQGFQTRNFGVFDTLICSCENNAINQNVNSVCKFNLQTHERFVLFLKKKAILYAKTRHDLEC